MHAHSVSISRVSNVYGEPQLSIYFGNISGKITPYAQVLINSTGIGAVPSSQCVNINLFLALYDY